MVSLAHRSTGLLFALATLLLACNVRKSRDDGPQSSLPARQRGTDLQPQTSASIPPSDGSAEPSQSPSIESAGGVGRARPAGTNVGGSSPTSDRFTDLRRTATGRVVAVGDLHGDLAATERVLRLAGVVDTTSHWVGGTTVVVQTGDQIDRGDQDREVLDWLEQLSREAATAGGAVIVLNGNHEVMNVRWDFRYVTPGSLAAFKRVPGLALDDARLAAFPMPARARAAAFMPGGPYAKLLAKRHIVALVGDTAFVHGGLRTSHIDGLVDLDREVRALLSGAPTSPATLDRIMDPDGPLWTRFYGGELDSTVCAELDTTLRALGVERLVIGHTVQRAGVTHGCDDRLWRIDVGLAAHYGGPTQALEIRDGQARVLTAPTP